MHLFCTSEQPLDAAQLAALEPYCAHIENCVLSKSQRLGGALRGALRGLPLQAGYFYSHSLTNRLQERAAAEKPDVVHCHLLRMAHYAATVEAPRKTIDYMDAFSAGAEKELSVCKNPLRRAMLRFEWKALQRFEAHIWPWFQAHCTISAQDARAMPVPSPESIVTVPNGVDFDRFHPRETEKQFDLLFTGHMAYPPNIEAAHFAATQILPLVQQQRPNTSLLIAGVGAPERIKALASKYIIVREHFDDIAEAFAISRVMLAPMTISIGLQNKILQAFATALPTVATTSANRAIGAPVPSCIRTADAAHVFANEVLELLKNNAVATDMASNAYAFVQQHFSWEVANQQLEQMLLNP